MRNYLFLFIILCFYACHECTCPTEYTTNYTEARWRQIEIGMDSNQVMHILGEPMLRDSLFYDFHKKKVGGFKNFWRYSNDSIGGEIFPCECWKSRKIFFDSLWRVGFIDTSIVYD